MKSRAEKILAILKDYHSDAKIELNFSSPLELLVATILSAQCTDVRVNQVTEHLFKKYRHADDYSNANLNDLEEEIRSTGFYHNKAKHIQQCCKMIAGRHAGQVPETMDELIALPGVGRKTANVVLGNAFGKPGLAVDTHVKRISNRLGLTRQTEPVKIEKDLQRIIPKDTWTQTSHLFIMHGRRTCYARKPSCQRCPVFDLCEWPGKLSR